MLFHEWAARWNIPQEAVADFLSHVTPERVAEEDDSSEGRIQSLIRLASPYEGGWLGRNNAGVAETETRPVRYGLGNDSASWWKDWRSPDLIGVTKMVIEPRHVGRTVGIATFIEVKHASWNPRDLNRPSNERERAQLTCLTHMASLGAIAGFATSPDDYRRYIAEYKNRV
jgi:hypothetical protein